MLILQCLVCDCQLRLRLGNADLRLQECHWRDRRLQLRHQLHTSHQLRQLSNERHHHRIIQLLFNQLYKL